MRQLRKVRNMLWWIDGGHWCKWKRVMVQEQNLGELHIWEIEHRMWMHSHAQFCFLSVRNDASRVSVPGDNPYTASFRRRSWCITSKALAKSTKRAPQFYFLSFILESHWSTKLVKAVWHEWFSLNLDWLGWTRLFLLKCARICLFMCFSNGFEKLTRQKLAYSLTDLNSFQT